MTNDKSDQEKSNQIRIHYQTLRLATNSAMDGRKVRPRCISRPSTPPQSRSIVPWTKPPSRRGVLGPAPNGETPEMGVLTPPQGGGPPP